MLLLNLHANKILSSLIASLQASIKENQRISKNIIIEYQRISKNIEEDGRISNKLEEIQELTGIEIN